MGLIDWVKRRNVGHELAKQFAREHGHESFESLASEIRQDEKLAKVRNATGREPECVPPSGSASADRDKTQQPEAKLQQPDKGRSWER
jgi:hypothetical protein